MHYNAHGFKSDKRPPISKGASRHGHCCSVGCLQPISSWPPRMRWGQRTLHQHLDSQWQCSDTPSPPEPDVLSLRKGRRSCSIHASGLGQRSDRVLKRTVIALMGLWIGLSGQADARTSTNRWQGATAKWETTKQWSLNKLPSASQDIVIADPGTFTITI